MKNLKFGLICRHNTRPVVPIMEPGPITLVLQIVMVAAKMTSIKSKKMCRFLFFFAQNLLKKKASTFTTLRWFDKNTCEIRAAGYTKFNAGPYYVCYECSFFDIDNNVCPDPNDVGSIDWSKTICSSKIGSCGVNNEGSQYFIVGFSLKFLLN